MSDHGATGEREATPPREMEIAMTPRPVTGRGSSQIENKGERLGSGEAGSGGDRYGERWGMWTGVKLFVLIFVERNEFGETSYGQRTTGSNGNEIGTGT